MHAKTYRITLGIVFLASAVLKIRTFIYGAPIADVLPVLQEPLSLWALVALDCAIASGCFGSTRTAPLAAWGAVAVAIVGNFAFLHGMRTAQVTTCGCFGPVKLNAIEHVALSACVFYLAARIVLARPSRGTTSPA